MSFSQIYVNSKAFQNMYTKNRDFKNENIPSGNPALSAKIWISVLAEIWRNWNSVFDCAGYASFKT
jgi:hypothetical protein